MAADPVRYIDANGISIAYQDSGTSGEPLILVNGFASTMDMWNPPFLSALSQKFRTIIFDNRGSGYTTRDQTPFSITLFAEDTAALMGALKIPRAHVLGLSMGASIAQELALAYPDRVNRLVLVAGSCGGKQMVMMQPAVWEQLSDKSGTGPEVADRMFSVLFPAGWLVSHDPWQYCPEVHETTSGEVAALQGEALFRWPGSFDRLPGIHHPTLVVTGTDDTVIPPENAVTLSERIPGARLVQVKGAGHGLMYQCSDRVANVVRDFLLES